MNMEKKWLAALAALFLAATAACAQSFPAYLKVSDTTITGYTEGVPANLVIPEVITKIKDHALMGCKTITSASVPGGVELEPGAFSGCTSLESVTIAEGVTRIGYCTFANCTSLESVTIPGSVTYIGDDLFGYCVKIREVRFGGTKAQWQAFDVRLNSGAIVRCSDGDIVIK